MIQEFDYCIFEPYFWNLLTALLVTALLFFLAGFLLGKRGKKVVTESSQSVNNQDALSIELEECKKKYNALKIASSGGKIQKDTSVQTSTKIAEDISVESDVSKKAEIENVASTQADTNVVSDENGEKESDVKVVSDAPKEESTSQSAGLTHATSEVADVKAASEILGKKVTADDLKIVEGIGPKIESILNMNSIKTWADLAESKPETITEYLLKYGGAAYKIHDPGTWPEQAELARKGKFEELKKLQDNLKGGKRV